MGQQEWGKKHMLRLGRAENEEKRQDDKTSSQQEWGKKHMLRSGRAENAEISEEEIHEAVRDLCMSKPNGVFLPMCPKPKRAMEIARLKREMARLKKEMIRNCSTDPWKCRIMKK